MNLSDLDGKLYRYAGDKTFEAVNSVATADSVMFLCPKCFVANGGPVGTHSVRVDFAGRGVPDEDCIRNSNGQPVRWNVAGTDLDDLTLTPSIQILHACQWHGFVTNGQIVGGI